MQAAKQAAYRHFSHHFNRDGTIDSVCPHCSTTVGTSTWEAVLESIESAHCCDPALLAHFDGERKKAPAMAAPPHAPELDRFDRVFA